MSQSRLENEVEQLNSQLRKVPSTSHYDVYDDVSILLGTARGIQPQRTANQAITAQERHRRGSVRYHNFVATYRLLSTFKNSTDSKVYGPIIDKLL